MAFTVSFIQPENYPSDDTSTVGGAINSSDTAFDGTIGELFSTSTSGFVGTSDVVRYMKVFIKNTGDEISDFTVFLQSLEYSDQLAFAFEASADDTSTNVLTMPSGYVDGDFTTPVGLDNGVQPSSTTVATNGTVAVWLRLTIAAGLTADSSATGVLSVAGTI